MPNKRPPNAEATEFRTGEQQVEIARQGGIASGIARREKKTIQKILSDLLDSEIKDSPQFAKLASKMGVESDKSVKDIFTMVCLLNSVKSGNLGDLEKLSKLLGEQTEIADTEAQKQADFLDAVKKAVSDAD
jgi:hypothetical protein